VSPALKLTLTTGFMGSQRHVSSRSSPGQDATGRDETGWAHDRRVDVLLAK
jgi:hypothetical protein